MFSAEEACVPGCLWRDSCSGSCKAAGPSCSACDLHEITPSERLCSIALAEREEQSRKSTLVLLMWHPQILVATFVVALIPTASAVNFNQCLENINNITVAGKTDNYGHLLPPSTPNATAITYGVCVSQCGAGQEPFQWTSFSQSFSSWLLPWLALVSQLPFGANDKPANLESMLLSVGSPTLAAYSLALTVLNGRWIAQLFVNYRYPNVRSAVRILSSLQQSPLQVVTDHALLASLVVLPQNHEWWSEFAVWLNYTQTWSISAAASILWVIIAYIFTLVDYFSQDLTSLNTNGQGVGSIGSLWLWLVPVVVGWLQISPKCDSERLKTALERANPLAYVAISNSAQNVAPSSVTPCSIAPSSAAPLHASSPTSTPTPCKASIISDHRAISFDLSEDEARWDEHSTPPIFNYARFLFWERAVMVVSDAFHNASERSYHHDPVIPGTEWQDPQSDDRSRHATAEEVEAYCRPRPGGVNHPWRRRHGLDASVVSQMLMASALALTLQWGTAGAAIIIEYFTPTVGLGCRSAAYIAYGGLSTMVWVMLLTSSILTYYSTIAPQEYKRRRIAPIQFRVARWMSIVLRRLGKLIAALNAVWIVTTGMLEFGGFYDRCYCNSSVFGLGRSAYYVIVLTQADVVNMRAAWIGGFCLGAGAVALFSGFVGLFINPPLPP